MSSATSNETVLAFSARSILNGTSPETHYCKLRHGTCVVFIVVESILSGAIIFGNSVFIATFLKFKELQVQVNYAIFSLAIVDLLTGLLFAPLSIISTYLIDMVPELQRLRYEKLFCLLKIFLGGSVILVSFLHQLLIAFERYIKICRSTRYLQLFSRKRHIMAIILTWLYGIAVHLPPLFGWHNWSPDKECRAKDMQREFTQYVILPHVPICMLVVFGLYAAIFRHVQLIKRRIDARFVTDNQAEVKPSHQNAPRITPVLYVRSRRVSQGGEAIASTLCAPCEMLLHQPGGAEPQIPPTSTKPDRGQANDVSISTTRNGRRPKVPRADSPTEPIPSTSKCNAACTTKKQNEVKAKPELSVDQIEHLGSEFINEGPAEQRQELRSPSVAADIPAIVTTMTKMEVKVSKMTALTVCTLIVLFLPSVILGSYIGQSENNGDIFVTLFNIAMELVLLSSAVNPLIYGLLNTNIRQAVFKLLKCNHLH